MSAGNLWVLETTNLNAGWTDLGTVPGVLAGWNWERAKFETVGSSLYLFGGTYQSSWDYLTDLRVIDTNNIGSSTDLSSTLRNAGPLPAGRLGPGSAMIGNTQRKPEGQRATKRCGLVVAVVSGLTQANGSPRSRIKNTRHDRNGCED
eukprot:2539384-Rhodomonas_salina.1